MNSVGVVLILQLEQIEEGDPRRYLPRYSDAYHDHSGSAYES